MGEAIWISAPLRYFNKNSLPNAPEIGDRMGFATLNYWKNMITSFAEKQENHKTNRTTILQKCNQHFKLTCTAEGRKSIIK